MSDRRQAAHSAPFVTVDADAASPATLFSCPLCCASFSHGDRVCSACPLGAGCDLVSCPNCGYTFPRSSKILGWLRRRFGRGGTR